MLNREDKMAMREATSSSNYYVYPQPLAKYDDIVSNPELFMASLEKLHASMGTKFMIPIIGGKDLDLHKLFVEVTSRGGIGKIIRERRWKEVTAVFNFPSTATNASFVLRKYYTSLLHHYEQMYYFKAQGWTPTSADSLAIPNSGMNLSQWTQPSRPLPFVQATNMQQQPTESSAARPASLAGCLLTGVIDGKFDSGYLVTVLLGSEELKGVLYEMPCNPTQQVTTTQPPFVLFANTKETVSTTPTTTTRLPRRRRRKKSEIKRRDPAHPKPNRSGYNFFFAEQHARLKLLHPGKDREISRMIGELWNNLTDLEKTVYQEKAAKDKERYRTEMEDYRERLRTGQVVRDAMPIQQRIPYTDLNLVEADVKKEDEAKSLDSVMQTPENESSTSKSDSDDNDLTIEKDLVNADVSDGLTLGLGVGPEMSNVDVFVPVKDAGEKVGEHINEKIGEEERLQQGLGSNNASGGSVEEHLEESL